MSRKKQDAESSLELLLDTMCNTFGGVMFIAIALVVLMSTLSQVKLPVQDPAAQLEALEAELDALTKRDQTLQKELEKLENHPGRAQITEIMKTRKALDAARIQAKVMQTQIPLEQSKILQQQKLLAEEITRCAEDQKKSAKLEAELRELRQRLAKMKSSTSESTCSMTFRIMEQSSDMPYFLIVSQNQLWRVGPEKDPQTKKFTPRQSDCTFENVVTAGDNAIKCTPIAGKGIPILLNGKPSPQVIELLRLIPEHRTPEFSISRDSFASFYVLRNYLTKNKIQHGVDLMFDCNKSFSYRVVQEKIPYEY